MRAKRLTSALPNHAAIARPIPEPAEVIVDALRSRRSSIHGAENAVPFEPAKGLCTFRILNCRFAVSRIWREFLLKEQQRSRFERRPRRQTVSGRRSECENNGE
jgi:hypothetical protein